MARIQCVAQRAALRGRKNLRPGAHVPCARASEEPATAGRGQPGATRFAMSLGREVAAGRRNLSLAV